MVSKDGEEVPFTRPVLIGDSGVKEWLKALEGEMRTTLALLLGEAVGATGDLAKTSRNDAQARKLAARSFSVRVLFRVLFALFVSCLS